MRRAVALSCVVSALAACGHEANVASRTPAHAWKPAPGGPTVECRPAGPLPRALDALHAACERADVYACRGLAESNDAFEIDRQLARDELKAACGGARDRACACAMYGSVLTYDPHERFDHEALQLLDAACVRGVSEACDETADLAELCRMDGGRPLCADLRAQARVRPMDPPEPVLAPAKLPAELAACFVARPSGEADATLPAGTVYCFAEDRFYVERPHEPWDERLVRWLAFPGDATAVHGDRDELRIEFTKHGTILRTSDGAAVITRAPGATLQAVEALPRVEDVCAHARRCTEAIARAIPPTPESDAPLPPPPSTLLECQRAESDAKAALRQAPPECR